MPLIAAISIFLTDGDTETPTLITLQDMPAPPHPSGKRWKLFARFQGNPRKLIIGRKLVDRLLRDGHVVEERGIEDLLKRRI